MRGKYNEEQTLNIERKSNESKKDNHAQPKRVNMEILEIETMSL